MSRWMTHAICDLCWQNWQPGRDPVRFREEAREVETCCWCGQPTLSGIYAREDQDLLRNCAGAR